MRKTNLILFTTFLFIIPILNILIRFNYGSYYECHSIISLKPLLLFSVYKEANLSSNYCISYATVIFFHLWIVSFLHYSLRFIKKIINYSAILIYIITVYFFVQDSVICSSIERIPDSIMLIKFGLQGIFPIFIALIIMFLTFFCININQQIVKDFLKRQDLNIDKDEIR